MLFLLEVRMALIAVVDDSRLARTFTATCLKKAGHEVIEIDPISLFDVLKTLKENPPEMILTDFLMPGCPGASLVRACREDETLSEVWIIVITAHRDDDVKQRLDRMGKVSFLHKPFESQALQAMVAEYL